MKIALVGVGIVVAFVAVLFCMLTISMGDIKRTTINEVDLSKIADGTYTGRFHKGRWTYDVAVTVQNHRIVEARNTNKRMDAMKDFNQKIASAMVQKQAINVDVVSGATVNTRAFEKAVENALTTAK